MQSLAPLTADDFKIKVKVPISKLEIFIDPSWINLCELGESPYIKNYLISADYSKGQKEQTYEPIAASFSAVIDNTDGLFHPQNSESAYKDYFKVGRKIRFWTGFRQGGTDYLWQWFIGVISDIYLDSSNKQVRIQGFDFMQYLFEIELKSPYWGASITEPVVLGQAEYEMPEDCNGPYIAYLDGVPIYEGEHWVYSSGTREFVFLPDYVPFGSGAGYLIIYYFTDQVPENVIADLLVTAKLYIDRAAALAAMDWTETGTIIEKVWFSSGSKLLNAIQKICERVDYRFFFKWNGQSAFKPIPECDTWENKKFFFSKDLITDPNYIENIDEVRNHVIVEGAIYSASDKFYKIVSGDSLLDSTIKDRHIAEVVADLPYETQALVSSARDVIVPFYVPVTMLALNYVYLNLYFPGLQVGDYPLNSPIIYLPSLYKGTPSYAWDWNEPPNGGFWGFVQEYYEAGRGANGSWSYNYRAFTKFNISPLFGFKFNVCELKWLLASMVSFGSGANAQISMLLHAINDYGTLDKDDWDAAVQVDYGVVNVYTDEIGAIYTEDVKTRIQSLIDSAQDYAAFRFKGETEPIDVSAANNYRLDEPLLYCELEEDTTQAVSLYTDNGAGFVYRGAYSTNQENIDLTSYFSGSGKKQLKFTCPRARRIDVLIRVGLTLNRA